MDQVIRELDLMQTNLYELSKAVADCAEESNLKEVCLDYFLAARAELRRADVYLAVLKPRGRL